jgi:hypothetical protein
MIGTVARANPKLELEVASIALICFTAWHFHLAIVYKSIGAARVSALTKKVKNSGCSVNIHQQAGSR